MKREGALQSINHEVSYLSDSTCTAGPMCIVVVVSFEATRTPAGSSWNL